MNEMERIRNCLRGRAASMERSRQMHLFGKEASEKTLTEEIDICGKAVPQFVNEFWTSRQRQACSIHEISYRACFKPQLPRFFINLLTDEGDTVYDPFGGRGTTAIETALLNRTVISNDINPLSKRLVKPRFFIPSHQDLKKRLENIKIDPANRADTDLSMFYHPKTETEIVSLKKYLLQREKQLSLDYIDRWIRMVATNRLTGHSRGFFSVYTLPPNQAASQKSQQRINKKREQKPEYRDVRSLIVKKSRSLIRDLTVRDMTCLRRASKNALLLTEKAADTPEIKSKSVRLTVTSPPFLDVINYAGDNWLRCWFNGFDPDLLSGSITTTSSIADWVEEMKAVFTELYRITAAGGWVAFEVGEVRKGTIKLDRHVIEPGCEAGFLCAGIIINKQNFTKTSNIWGIKNNTDGTNTNRIILFCRP